MLPQFQSADRILNQLQNVWAALLNPLLDNPLPQGRLITRLALASGTNTINHQLGRKLQGWVIVRQRAAGTVYDTQDSNSHPELTLTLTASTGLTVDLYVF